MEVYWLHLPLLDYTIVKLYGTFKSILSKSSGVCAGCDCFPFSFFGCFLFLFFSCGRSQESEGGGGGRGTRDNY